MRSQTVQLARLLPEPPLSRIAPIAVVIPTFNRGLAVLAVLEQVLCCDPQPSEIWVHVDMADGALELELKRRFPDVGVLTSPTRLGPGGGRHRCLEACTTPYAVSFDDDSYPADRDFFSSIERLFRKHPEAGVLAARIWHRHEPQRERNERLTPVPTYIGCGYAVRLDAYRSVRGFLARPVTYGIEEDDLSIQLFAKGWRVFEAGDLRVFHDTELRHHESADVTAGSIANVGLYAFLHYPLVGLGWGVLQVANKIVYCARRGRIHGIMRGLLTIPIACYRNRQYRKPIAWQTVKKYLRFRRTGIA